MKSLTFLAFAAPFLHSVLGGPMAGQQWKVDVGANGNFTFVPPFVNAAVGDTILFTFHPKSHTVTQSAFDEPCVPLPGGFDTAFNNPVANDSVSPLPTYQVTVSNMDPIWVFCRQVGHCGKGMVFAVNAPATGDHTFAAFQALAIKINGTDSSTPPPPPPPTSSSTYGSSSGGDYGEGGSDSGSGSGSDSGSGSGSGYGYEPASYGGSYTTLPAEPWQSATATLSNDHTTYTTTYTSYAGSAQPSYSPSGPQDHKVTVGANGQLTFVPPTIQASIGDTVTFEFHQKNHTATFSTFDDPCTPLEGAKAWDSGFMFVPDNVTANFPTVTITINDTTPIWGFCRQQGPPVHCAKGMVFAINSVEGSQWNWDTFQGNAQSLLGAVTTGGGGDNSTSPPGGKGNGAVSMSRNVGAAILMIAAASVGMIL